MCQRVKICIFLGLSSKTLARASLIPNGISLVGGRIGNENGGYRYRLRAARPVILPSFEFSFIKMNRPFKLFFTIGRSLLRTFRAPRG
jgi:hypothetical protein